jgi:hypothetical protein
MRAAATPIDDFVHGVLSRAVIDGRQVKLTDHLPKRGDYLAVAKVLEGMGGRWDKKARAHVFQADPAGPIAHALATKTFVHRKKTLQLFETPEELAEEMIELADLRAGMSMLEPSAGTGRIVRAALKRTAAVAAVEIDAVNCQSLALLGIPYWLADFTVWACQHQAKRFDRIVMNPPFTGAQDIAHVTAAWPLLVPGGRLVAVLSEGAFTRTEWQARLFQAWLRENEAEIRVLPAGTFRGSGTDVRSRLITATRGA